MPRLSGTSTSFFSYSGHGNTPGLFTYSETYLSPSELQQAFGSSYNQYACFLDACHSGVFPNNMTNGVISSACKSDENSTESPSLQNGIFSYFLIQGLETESAWGPNNILTAEELHTYASPKTTN